MAAVNTHGAMNQPQKNDTPVAAAMKPGDALLSRADINNINTFNRAPSGNILPEQRFILVATDRVKSRNGNEVSVNVGARLKRVSDQNGFGDHSDIHYAYLVNTDNFEPLMDPPIPTNNTKHMIKQIETPNLTWVDRYKAPSGTYLSCTRPEFHRYTIHSREVAIRNDWEQVFRLDDGTIKTEAIREGGGQRSENGKAAAKVAIQLSCFASALDKGDALALEQGGVRRLVVTRSNDLEVVGLLFL
ncbi:unnamed protein product [Zymoseptoria tritici ST99CH_1E4]|uniref:Uncharacterized protein n=1 Tax=Zymoseptoria tritici ST99CH_1E4 TaxID=1276532 RepID=A0A2H1G4J1_ZYMTR|nr:unnamed protein product [Zymoseptoria tritici ST99CH_1E4]